MIELIREVDPRLVLDANNDAASEFELEYTVLGAEAGTDTTAAEEARDAVLADAPADIGGVPVQRVELREANVRELGDGTISSTYFAKVKYAPNQVGGGGPPAQVIGDTQLGFSTGGGTERVFTAIQQTSFAASGQTAPDVKGRIRVTDRGAEGADIIPPRLRIRETRIEALAAVEQVTFQANLALLTGAINNAAFRGFAAQEVLLAAAQAEQLDGQKVRLTYDFEVQPREDNITIQGIAGITKEGHDVLWLLTRPDPSAQQFGTDRAIAAYSAQVFPLGNFALLDPGPAP